MRRFVPVVVATAGVLAPLAVSPTTAADTMPTPPYVDHVDWAKWGDLSSLRVFPTESGRQAALISNPVDMSSSVEADEAWAEVLTLSPDADIPGMWAQFICHWDYAELAAPGKSSWNLEPWRPEVSVEDMLEAGCNPGGTEEPF